ncbi:MAG: hypothetical protein OR994_06685, partial [Candidatus Poseidoniales archaeon]|nr:hypothetical protein [Candidatus Poseidoniales archaeon]
VVVQVVVVVVQVVVVVVQEAEEDLVDFLNYILDVKKWKHIGKVFPNFQIAKVKKNGLKFQKKYH